jgi:two-component system, LuxR family, sensor kinase FixL
MRSPNLRHGFLIVGYLLGYVVLDGMSYVYPIAPPLGITPWNPQAGLSLALLLRYGLANAPWLFVASLLAEVIVRGIHVSLPILIATAALPAGIYTILAGVLRHWSGGGQHTLTSLRHAVFFVAAVAAAAGILAVSLVTLFRASGHLPVELYGKSIAQFWIGDVIGIIVTTPLLLVFARPYPEPGRRAAVEIVVQVAAVVLALWIVFGSGLMEELKLFYVLFLPLVWIAMRWGIEGTTVATMVIQLGLILAMRLGGYGASAVLEFHFLLLAVAVTGLFLGVTVSERRAIEQRLREKQDELDRTLRLAGASEMASALAHELNQPLAAIGTYLRACEMLVEENKQSSVMLRETIAKVVAEVKRAGNVVHRLRDFFRTGSGQLVPIRVDELLKSTIAAARQRSERHNVLWKLSCDPALPDILVDRIQIETVMHNLISNAIDALKLMPPDERRIIVSATRAGSLFVRVTITDTGPGLPTEVSSELFRPFRTSKPHGMGLGLSISRSLVEAHGGRLWLESTASGCSFSLTLPCAQTAHD